MTLLVLGAALALVAGLSLGLLGGGGSILTVPILVYVLGVDPRSAIATSLVVVGVTSAAGTLSRVSRSQWTVRWIPSTSLIEGFHPRSSRAS